MHRLLYVHACIRSADTSIADLSHDETTTGRLALLRTLDNDISHPPRFFPATEAEQMTMEGSSIPRVRNLLLSFT